MFFWGREIEVGLVKRLLLRCVALRCVAWRRMLLRRLVLRLTSVALEDLPHAFPLGNVPVGMRLLEPRLIAAASLRRIGLHS